MVTNTTRVALSVTFSSILILFLSFTFSIFDKNYINKNISYWNHTKNRTESYCELSKPSNYFIREPYNSYTSMFFVTPAVFSLVYFIFDLMKPGKTFLSKHPFFSLIFGIINSLHFSGTLMNHLCSCQLGLILDNMFMWSTLAYILNLTFFINISKIRKMKKASFYSAFIVIFVLEVGILGAISFSDISTLSRSMLSSVLFVFIVISNIIFVSRNQKKRKSIISKNNSLFWISFVMLIVGIFYIISDSVFCVKGGIMSAVGVGFHMVWHIFGSIALTFIYLYQWGMIRT